MTFRHDSFQPIGIKLFVTLPLPNFSRPAGSIELFKKSEELRAEIDRIANPREDKRSIVCETSGNILSTKDNDERVSRDGGLSFSVYIHAFFCD